METVLIEWLNLVVRWLHVVAGMAWIGSSFYFIHLDLSLKARSGLPQGVQGDAWQAGLHEGDRMSIIDAADASPAAPAPGRPEPPAPAAQAASREDPSGILASTA